MDIDIRCSTLWSGINPKDVFTWFLEVLPAVIGGAILLATYNRFRLTPVLYVFILTHCLVLMIGGHYTYAEVPLFDNLFGLERNNYDKAGHFFQGFVPALIAREILIRKEVVNGNAWRNLFVISVSLAFSALYEIIEMVGCISHRGKCRSVFGHTRICLGYPVGYGIGIIGCDISNSAACKNT